LSKLWNSYKLAFYILAHPFDGFYDMKFRGKGKLWVAAFNFLLMWASYSFNRQYAALIVNRSYPLSYNSLADGFTLLMLLILWCAANWSVTTLTGGEGRFPEIIMANCYAMTPMILVFIPAALLSNILAEGEGAFYILLIGISVVWFILLAFTGMVTVHNYTFGKALFTAFLTLLALLIIVFLIALLATLYQQLITFFLSIYREIIFRY